MGQIVRRVAHPTGITSPQQEFLAPRLFQDGALVVQSQLAVGIRPELHVAWRAPTKYWRKGFRFMLFHSTRGFSPKRYPEDLVEHGQLIVEAMRDDRHVVYPDEGTQFYAGVLHKEWRWWGTEALAIARFSEMIPSAQVALARIRAQLELQELLHQSEIAPLLHKAQKYEALLRLSESRRKLKQSRSGNESKPASGPLDEELANIEAVLAAVFTKKMRIADLKRNAQFQALSPEEQQELIQYIEERLNAGEISARRDMRGS